MKQDEKTDAPAEEDRTMRRRKPVDDGLTPVSKEGVTIRVHPARLVEHESLGWRRNGSAG